MDEIVAYAKTQKLITLGKLEAKFQISYVKALLVMDELVQIGVVSENGEVIHEQEC